MRNIIILLLIACVTFSCGDFLKEYSQDLTYAGSCDDLEELLIGGGYMGTTTGSTTALTLTGDKANYMPWLHVMDDDTEEAEAAVAVYSATSFDFIEPFHHWEARPFHRGGMDYKDETWSRLYKHISIANVVLSQVDDMTSDPVELRNKIKGEAQFLRAMYYYFLVNIYAKPYSKATASSEPGVPLKLLEHVEDIHFTRTPIDVVYNQIASDLTDAAENLAGATQTTVYQANEYGSRLLLSRVYLFMEQWENVINECNKVLEGGFSLLDLNTSDHTYSFTYPDSPETIFSQGTYSMDVIMYEPIGGVANPPECVQVSPDFLSTFEPNDLRPSAFFLVGRPDNRLRGIKLRDKSAHGLVSDICLLRYAEVFLNKAEALAMLGKDGEAIDVIQELRKKRFSPEHLGTINLQGEELVNFIRDERRRELCYEGHRWFDLRRYAVSSKYPYSKEIIHRHFERRVENYVAINEYAGDYRLKVYSDETAYVLPIPDYVIEFNDGTITQNFREEREINN